MGFPTGVGNPTTKGGWEKLVGVGNPGGVGILWWVGNPGEVGYPGEVGNPGGGPYLTLNPR